MQFIWFFCFLSIKSNSSNINIHSNNCLLQITQKLEVQQFIFNQRNENRFQNSIEQNFMENNMYQMDLKIEQHTPFLEELQTYFYFPQSFHLLLFIFRTRLLQISPQNSPNFQSKKQKIIFKYLEMSMLRMRQALQIQLLKGSQFQVTSYEPMIQIKLSRNILIMIQKIEQKMRKLLGEEELLNGKYRFLKKKLGEGGFGVVHLVQDVQTGEKLALKEIFMREKDEAFFNNEVQALQKLKGKPYIIEIKDYFSTADRHYLVTELCNGGTLSSHIKKPELKVEIFLNVIRALLETVVTMNRSKLVHRDFKPGNVLFTSQMEVKIIDFGLSATHDQIRQGQFLQAGSLLYSAPQSLAKRQYSPKSDIWAIGVIFYKMIMKKVPWFEKTASKQLKKITEEPIADLYPKQLVAWMKKFIDRSLEINPSQRADAKQLLKILPTLSTLDKEQNSSKQILSSKTLQDIKNIRKTISNTSQIPSLSLQSNILIKQKENIPPSKTTSNKTSKIIEKILRLLINQSDFCSLQEEILILLKKIIHKGHDGETEKLIQKVQLQKFLTERLSQKLYKIQTVEYKQILQNEKVVFKNTKPHMETNSLVTAHLVRCKSHGITATSSLVKTQFATERPLDEALKWFSCNIQSIKDSKLTTLYQFLTILKQYWNIQAREQGAIKLLEISEKQ